MSHHKHVTSSGAAARDRGRARLRAVTVSAAAASLIAAGGVAFTLPGVATASASAFGTVGLVAKGWGTQITLDLSKVHGPLSCYLVAVSKSGEKQVALSWMVPVPGDGVPGHPAHLVVEGGTAIAMKNLARIDIDVVNGPTLLSIPV